MSTVAVGVINGPGDSCRLGGRFLPAGMRREHPPAYHYSRAPTSNEPGTNDGLMYTARGTASLLVAALSQECWTDANRELGTDGVRGSASVMETCAPASMAISWVKGREEDS